LSLVGWFVIGILVKGFYFFFDGIPEASGCNEGNEAVKNMFGTREQEKLFASPRDQGSHHEDGHHCFAQGKHSVLVFENIFKEGFHVLEKFGKQFSKKSRLRSIHNMNIHFDVIQIPALVDANRIRWLRLIQGLLCNGQQGVKKLVGVVFYSWCVFHKF